jgi:UPF0148 protein
MEEDEVLERITKLLEKGCTMLATHHECGAPLFRCQGEVVCPVCSFGLDKGEPASVSSPSSKPMDNKPSELQRPKAAEAGVLQEFAAENNLKPEVGNLRGPLLRKVRALAEAMEMEQDLENVKRQIDCIEALLRVLASLPR